MLYSDRESARKIEGGGERGRGTDRERGREMEKEREGVK